MRHTKLLAISLAILVALTLAGCTSSQQLEERADQLDAAADRIEQILEQNPADIIEESELARAIVDALPDSWRTPAEDALEVAGDVREGAQLTAAKLREASDKLDEQAALEASETENTFFAGLTLAETLIGTNGIIAGIAGLLWKRKKKADEQAQASNAIIRDIVSSIEASPKVKAAIKDGGNAELRASMGFDTQARVEEVKRELDNP